VEAAPGHTNAATPAATARAGQASPSPSAAPSVLNPNGDATAVPLAVPAVRRLARELGVDLSQVTPTGAEGRLTEADIRAAAAARGSNTGPTVAPERIPLRGIRRAAAEHLAAAHQNTA